jgi:hypothetical protein
MVFLLVIKVNNFEKLKKAKQVIISILNQLEKPLNMHLKWSKPHKNSIVMSNRR